MTKRRVISRTLGLRVEVRGTPKPRRLLSLLHEETEIKLPSLMSVSVLNPQSFISFSKHRAY
jgi:hypothetical protein